MLLPRRVEMRTMGIVLLLAAAPAARADTFGADVKFLRGHTDLVVLGSGGARVAVAPAWQGRVVTSTAGGDDGHSYGWINRDLVASGKTLPHMTPYGGEDRLWLGPEGGQFSIFFKKGDPFDFDHWQTPAALDTEAWAVTAKDASHVTVSRPMKLTNHAGTAFDLRVERTVRLLDAGSVKQSCGHIPPRALTWVAYQSENRLVNAGRVPWTRAGGLLSIWILGMMNPSPATTVVVPAAPGAAVNDVYFGKVPPERLVKKGDTFYFRGDGQQRGKIGLGPRHARAVLGSYDAASRVLTVVWYNRPAGPRPYVNSLWPPQKDPFGGDAVNAYNDGAPAPGVKPLGPFYELETSSPAAELAPGAALDHVHRTMHFQGAPPALDAVARACLGVGLAEIEGAFKASSGARPSAR
jgi:hypothetical protein